MLPTLSHYAVPKGTRGEAHKQKALCEKHFLPTNRQQRLTGNISPADPANARLIYLDKTFPQVEFERHLPPLGVMALNGRSALQEKLPAEFDPEMRF